jgi:hypothetical protein
MEQARAERRVRSVFYRDGGAGLVVLAEPGEGALVPAPVLEHLGRRLDEVPLGGGAGEPGERGLAAKVVHAVAKLTNTLEKKERKKERGGGEGGRGRDRQGV